jgi:hypothetical protein
MIFQYSEHIGEMARTNVHGFKQFINYIFVLGTGMQAKLLVHEKVVLSLVKGKEIGIKILFEN